MSSAFLGIQAALLAALNTAPALAGGRISANRLRPITAGQATAIVLRLDQSAGAEEVLGMLDWQTSFSVECYARGATGGDPADAIDTLLTDTWARLTGIDSATLGADISLSPQIDWQYDDAETPVVCALIRLTARHRTTCKTLTPP